ncbi:MAG: acetyl-CoA hydrolase [Bdellovibrio sp.]|nr:acetyl-CoA hydrolase [Bdellovibrio sp.]
MATPLGLGKPNLLLNELYRRIKNNPSLSLKIFSALALNPPSPKEDLAKRFFVPFAKRHWGVDYPELQYAKDAEANLLPSNVRIHEFYFRAGAAMNSPKLQQDYQSINYTRVAESVYNEGVNLVVQMIAKNPKSETARYSLSCNPDVTLDLVDLYRAGKKNVLMVGMVHPDLPFLGGEAEVPADFFNLIIEDTTIQHEIFALPKLPISAADHVIGFYASQLVADDGTLQIGIGSLSDAVIASMLMRHQNNLLYNELVEQIWKNGKKSSSLPYEKSPFKEGIYGLSEMVTDGYMHLREAGILKREVIDEKSGAKTYLHGAFYLGSKKFYSWLRELNPENFSGIRMTRVSKVNDLYDPHELVLRMQRRNPRFLNTCMQVTLLGGAASETLENGSVVSGVGGQYNFVAMAQELKNSRSILMLRSVRESKGKRFSNIVWSHGHLTIPRHLRDIVITEYGVADLKNKSDEECVKAMIEIADAEFQEALVKKAKQHRKLSLDYQITETAKQNTSENVKKFIARGRQSEVFKAFALGSDFTEVEQNLVAALEPIQNLASTPGVSAKLKLFAWALNGLVIDANPFAAELERMDLIKPQGLMAKIYRGLLLKVLNEQKIYEFN